jgi:hypothetical protein
MDDNTRRQRVYQGKVAIVACLSKLPKTQHDPHYFAVNVTLLMVNLEFALIVPCRYFSTMYTCSQIGWSSLDVIVEGMKH